MSTSKIKVYINEAKFIARQAKINKWKIRGRLEKIHGEAG